MTASFIFCATVTAISAVISLGFSIEAALRATVPPLPPLRIRLVLLRNQHIVSRKTDPASLFLDVERGS